MAQKEIQAGGGEEALVYAFFSQMAFVIVAIAAIVFSVHLYDAILLFGIVMFIGVITNFRLSLVKDALLNQYED